AYASKQVPEARGEGQAIARQADGYSQRVIAQAEGEASRFLQVLAEYHKAPEVTRERLYLEAVESVMSRSSKVLVDVQGSNSLMYLPIDKLLTEGRRGTGDSASPAASGVLEPVPSSGFDSSGRRTRTRSDGRSR
ncbi:MAG: FtsH protease activity modulator HflK, partial [Gammaproteobacteria bacterium]